MSWKDFGRKGIKCLSRTAVLIFSMSVHTRIRDARKRGDVLILVLE